MFTNEEIRKAIEKYQKEHPLHFGTMLDVTAISSEEGVNIISQTIEEISKKVEEDTDLWCICEMAKMYMQGVRPVYPVKQKDEWISVKDKLPDIDGYYLVTEKHPYHNSITIVHFTKDLKSIDEFDFYNKSGPGWYVFDGEYGYIEVTSVVAWQLLPEPYEKGDVE